MNIIITDTISIGLLALGANMSSKAAFGNKIQVLTEKGSKIGYIIGGSLLSAGLMALILWILKLTLTVTFSYYSVIILGMLSYIIGFNKTIPGQYVEDKTPE